LLLSATAAGLVGWAAGFPLLVLFLVLAVYAAWQIFNLWRLHQWVRNPLSDLPQSHGLWANIYDGISKMVLQDRKQREKYRDMVGEFRSLTDAFPDATLVIDQNDVIIWFNRSAENLLNLKNPGDLGQPVTNLVRGPDFSNWLAVQQHLKSPLEMSSPRGDGRWLTITAVVLRENQRLVILRDTTEVHRLEKVRRDFVANISHELRTPLTVVQGYLELLEDHSSDDVAGAVGKMLLQTGHMQSLLDDLLELSRVQSGRLKGDEEVVNVGAMLMQIKEQAEELSRGQHELVFSIDHELLLAGVAADLESAFGNLVSNAIKYTPPNGRIEVSWKDDEKGPSLVVRDNGIGIQAREIPRITERFYRVNSDRSRNTGGTGLGLAITKHVLNAHSAELAIRSELGEGSTFTVIFPEERSRRGANATA
jgi:two-component system phosphate regulon sensor histidine kinase PhoR